jgi:hypothetical protein
MKSIIVYSGIALTLIGCSTTQTDLLATAKTVAENELLPPAAPSNRLRFHLATQGLPNTGRWKSAPAIADINKDGILDLAVHPRLENGARAWLGSAQGAWTDTSQGLDMDTSCGGGIDLGDINNDGKLDIAVADHCQSLFVYLGQDGNTWKPVTQGLTSALAQKIEKLSPETNALKGAEELALGDVNEDGFLDIVTTGSDEGGFSVFLGDGSGKKWKETKADGLPSAEDPGNEEYQAGWSFDIQLIDMNNDKHLDVVASYYSGPHIWLGDGKGHWQSKATGLTVTSMGGVYRRLSVADINGDGLKDLAIANNLNGAEAYLQNADGTWKGPTDMLPQIKDGATAVALGDLDGDGHTDAVIGGRLSSKIEDPSGLFIVLGDGKGNWQLEQGTQLPAEGMEEIWGIALTDLNNDKRLDIVVTSGSTSTSTVKTHATQLKKGFNNALPTNQLSKNKAGKSQYPHLQVWLNDPLTKK